MSELKPCQFCGSEDLEVCNTHTPSYWVECHGCEARACGESFKYTTKQHDNFHTKPLPKPYVLARESAIAAWNRRPEIDRAKEAVILEAKSVVQRAGRRPDGTAWADLNINDLAAKVSLLQERENGV